MTMAFLCNEAKFFKTKNLPSTEQIGPGYYISQSVKRNIKKSYKPFGSGVSKNIKPNIDNIPLNHSKNIYCPNLNPALCTDYYFDCSLLQFFQNKS